MKPTKNQIHPNDCIHKKMKEKYKTKLQYLVEYMKFCPKGFNCVKTDLRDLCKAKDVGLDHFLMCLEEKPYECPSAIAYNNEFYCDCPLRVFIAKNIEHYLNDSCVCKEQNQTTLVG